MKKTTRKSFSRQAVAVVMCMFLIISLTAVGFASWLISNSGGGKGDGNVSSSDVSDAILGVTVNNATNLGKITFGPLKTDTTGNIRFNEAQADDVENLKITVTGSIQKFATLKQMGVTIQVPDGVITAAGYKLDGDSYVVDPNLPKYITLPAGAVDKNGKAIVADSVNYQPANTTVFTKGSDDTATFKFDVAFGWGELFKFEGKGENPGIYLDRQNEQGESLVTNLDDLLAIANVGKEENEKYTKLTAEAKRDILQAMQDIIGKDAKFTVIINAEAK